MTKVEYSTDEKEGLNDKYGGLPSSLTHESIIKSRFEELAKDSYQSQVAQTTIPNVISNQPQKIQITNIQTEGVTGNVVSSTSVSSTTY